MNPLEVVYAGNFRGSINVENAVQWSATNDVALITDLGVSVLSLVCCPTEDGYPLVFDQTFIPNPEETLVLSDEVDRDLLHNNLDTDDLHYLMLDHTLSPSTSNAPLFRSYKRAVWSPSTLSYKGKCFLATLTNDHRLCVWKLKESDWIQIADLSHQYMNTKKISENGISDKKMDEVKKAASEFTKMRNRSFDMAAIDIAWTHAFREKGKQSFVCLVAAMKNGRIAFWKADIKNQEECEFSLSWECKVDVGTVSSLSWQITSEHSGFLLIGCHNGEVAVLPVLRRADNLVMEEAIFLSDDDLIPVSHIFCQKLPMQNKYLVVFTKGKFIVCFKLSQPKDSFSLLIEGKTWTERLSDLPVTGMHLSMADDGDIILNICTLGAEILQVKIDKDTKFKQRNITPENSDKYQPMGINLSPNRVFLSVFYRISVIYDHLRSKEPLLLQVYTCCSIKQVCQRLLRNLKKENSLLKYYVDSLNCIHAYASTMDGFPEELNELMESKQDDWKTLPVTLLQFLRFLKRMPVSSDDAEEDEVVVNALTSALMTRYIQNKITRHGENISNLTQTQKQSLFNFCKWLVMTKNNTQEQEELCQKIQQELDKDVSIKEVCPICQSEVSFNNLEEDQCTKNHKFPRCIKTLLLCSEVPYRKCNSCKVFAFRDKVWDDGNDCTLCSMTLV